MEFVIGVGLKEYKVKATNAPIAKGIAKGRHRAKYPGSKASAVVLKWRKGKGSKWHK